MVFMVCTVRVGDPERPGILFTILLCNLSYGGGGI